MKDLLKFFDQQNISKKSLSSGPRKRKRERVRPKKKERKRKGLRCLYEIVDIATVYHSRYRRHIIIFKIFMKQLRSYFS